MSIDWDRVFADLAELRSRQFNWDGEGAEHFQASTVEHARTFAAAIGDVGIQPAISGCRDGTIDLFYRNSKLEALVNVDHDKCDYFARTVYDATLKGDQRHLKALREFMLTLPNADGVPQLIESQP